MITQRNTRYGLGRHPRRRCRPHRYLPSVAAPGTCQVCRLIIANAVHDEAAIPDPYPDAGMRAAGEALRAA
jgi:hypothetical protein